MEEQGTESTGVQQDKDRLELEKLQLELEQLRHPVRASLSSFAWRDIVAISVATFGILLALMTGLFNVRSERLRIERIQLEQGNRKLEATKLDLQEEQDRLQEEHRTTREELAIHEKEWRAIRELSRPPERGKLVTQVTLSVTRQ